jgi:hypothetical protein
MKHRKRKYPARRRRAVGKIDTTTMILLGVAGVAVLYFVMKPAATVVPVTSTVAKPITSTASSTNTAITSGANVADTLINNLVPAV